MLYSEATITRALARHRELLAEADRERRLALAGSGRTGHAAMRRVIAGLGARRVIPSTPTTASAAT